MKSFFKPTPMLPGNGFNGIFNREDNQVCCGQQARNVFGPKTNVLPVSRFGKGYVGTFNQNTSVCCDETKETPVTISR